MRAEIRSFFSYFNALKGGANNDVSQILSLYDNLFHPDAQVITGNGPVGKAEWRAMVEKFAGAGARIDVLGFETVADDAIAYSAKLHFPDGKVEKVHSKGIFKDGQLYRIEPTEKDVYNTDRLAGKLGDALGAADANPDLRRGLEAFVGWFTSVDGETSKAFDAVSPRFDALFHPEAQVTTGNGVLGLAEWRAFVEKFTTGGGKVNLRGFEVLSGDEIRYKLEMVMPTGVVQSSVTKGTFKEGRLYRVVPQDPEVYNADESRLGKGIAAAASEKPAAALSQ
ncbi:hypothetical protein ACHAXT_009092 [Thalassiosira profunda]